MLAEGYGWLLTSWPYSERALFITITALVHSGTFWTLNALFAGLYYSGTLSAYKIPRKKEPSAALVQKCLRSLVFNHLVVQPLVLWAFFEAFAAVGVHMHSPVPSGLQLASEVALGFIINDFLFYWTHRALHHPALYTRFHKQHHMFYSSIGIAAEYAGPVETLLSNTLPTLAGPLLLRSHPLTFWVYLGLRVWETVESHSGYAFPWSPWSLFDWQGGAQAHDFHHSANVGNYGGVCFSFWDTLMGTDAAYRRYLAERDSKTE